VQDERGWIWRGRRHAIGQRIHCGKRAVAEGGEGGVNVVAKEQRSGGGENGHTCVHDDGEDIGKKGAGGVRMRAMVEEGEGG
jgi:hypothetical protein